MNNALPINTRKVTAHFRKRGWSKASMQMTRMGLTYRHPEVPGHMVTVAKGGVDAFIVTGPRLTAISRTGVNVKDLEAKGISLDGLNRHTPNLHLVMRIVDYLTPEQEGEQ